MTAEQQPPQFDEEEWKRETAQWETELHDTEAKIVIERQRALQMKLHDIDDFLREMPATFPERETIRGLVGAAAQLTEAGQEEYSRGLVTREGILARVRERLHRALPSLGFDIETVAKLDRCREYERQDDE
jgi:hypothetical protein